MPDIINGLILTSIMFIGFILNLFMPKFLDEEKKPNA